MYEIRGTMTYRTNGIGICTPEIIWLVQNHLPILLRTEVCPEGSTRYACNVIIKTGSCTENEVKICCKFKKIYIVTYIRIQCIYACSVFQYVCVFWSSNVRFFFFQKNLEIEYLMTLNDKADIFTKIRTSKQGRNALYYQQILARISNVLAVNLKNTLSTAQSNYSNLQNIWLTNTTAVLYNANVRDFLFEFIFSSRIQIHFTGNSFWTRPRAIEDEHICLLCTRFWAPWSVLRSLSTTSL
jgi:hypothetical protein